jgi:tetratricopeptide (TPR) repeat protein
VDALNSKAHALIGMGEYNQAIAFFDKVLAIDHNNIDALDDKRSLMDPDAIAK